MIISLLSLIHSLLPGCTANRSKPRLFISHAVVHPNRRMSKSRAASQRETVAAVGGFLHRLVSVGPPSLQIRVFG